MKKRLRKFFFFLVIFVLAVLALAKFSGHLFLRMYVTAGIGNCRKIPVLCMAPSETIVNPEIDRGYIEQLIPYDFPKISVSLPKGLAVVQETIKKVYYKRKKRDYTERVVYILCQPRNFFVDLYPQMKKQGIPDNFEFIRRTMHANTQLIKNVGDAFFVIMKGIFIPYLGDQKNVKMVAFQLGDKKGFINYNLSHTFFDCNIVNKNGDFCKIYIKDDTASLDLNKVFSVISTVRGKAP
jgi:hypothetical protein